MKASTVVVGVLCVAACLTGLAIYLFDFANKPLSSESTFWAMAVVCPVAFGTYLKSKKIGAVLLMVLYASATAGAYQMIKGECRLGNCSTQNPVALLIAGMFAGAHMIAMFAALVLMCIGAVKTFRIHPLT